MPAPAADRAIDPAAPARSPSHLAAAAPRSIRRPGFPPIISTTSPKPSWCWKWPAPCRSACDDLRGLAAEDLRASISPPPVSATATPSSPPTRPPIRRAGGARTGPPNCSMRCCWRTRDAVAATCRHAGDRSDRAPRRGPAAAADRAHRGLDQRHRHRGRQTGRDRKPRSMLCSAGEHRTRRPRLSRPPLSRRQRRHHPRRPRAGRAPRARARRSASGPCRAAWSRPAKR